MTQQARLLAAPTALPKGVRKDAGLPMGYGAWPLQNALLMTPPSTRTAAPVVAEARGLAR